MTSTDPIRRNGLYRVLAEHLERGDTTAVALTTAALERIDAAAELNAVVAVNNEEALAQAEHSDALRAAGAAMGPLAGLPALVKDNTNVHGMRTTHGSLIYAQAPPADHDDTVVTQLRNAGAIIIGKTNLSEFAMEAIADNLVFGATHNPWRTGISPGGSSGGSAAALSAGLAAVATGTDGGGSSRIPAALCGLLGMKPTSGVLGNRYAQLPVELSSNGPMATTTADLRVLAEIMLTAQPGDPSCVQGPPTSWADPVDTVIAVPRIAGSNPLPAAIESAFTAAALAFGESIGRPVTFRDDALLDESADETWATIYSPEDAFTVGWDVIESNRELLDSRVLPWIDQGMRTTMEQYLRARRDRLGHVLILDEILGTSNIVLSPTVTTAAYPVAGHPGDLMPIDSFNTAALNLTGHPALSAPAGFVDGIPFGLQVIGPRGSDLWLIDLAARFEAQNPWPLVAEGYEVFVP
ncbi:amidase [Mycolicibacterium sp. PDY-3]|uniref:amidase n=1 Tax=Mycolicibacterium sp. PDY-3 TaxID=3376069 RepID=UPI0037A07255